MVLNRWYFSGRHWVAFYSKDGKHWEFFDTYGRHPADIPGHGGMTSFPEFLQEDYQWNIKRIQGLSDVCGEYCIAFLKLRSAGVSMQEFIDMFHSERYEENDELIRGLVY